jgi:hypothetical protein
MSPPCLNGLSVWIWVLLIVGAVLVFLFWAVWCWRQQRQGVTIAKSFSFLEAVLSAAHSDPKLSRLHGRASSSHPRLDLAEAQACCCCLPLSLGLTLLGLVDLARLGVVIAYAAESIGTYEQTDFERHPDAAYAHLMVPHARQVAESFLWPSLVISGIKAALWLLCIPTLCCELVWPLRLLLVWLPVDWIHTAVFAANNANFAQVRTGAIARSWPGCSRWLWPGCAQPAISHGCFAPALASDRSSAKWTSGSLPSQGTSAFVGTTSRPCRLGRCCFLPRACPRCGE